MALPHQVSSFKHMDTNANKEAFNTCVAKCRVVKEHYIGVLRSRWHLRTQLNLKKDTAFMIWWIILCAKFHNYVMTLNDEWTKAHAKIELESDPGPIGSTPIVSRAG